MPLQYMSSGKFHWNPANSYEEEAPEHYMTNIHPDRKRQLNVSL